MKALRVPCEVKSSAINGDGLFACADISNGEIVAMYPIGATVITEEKYRKEQLAGNKLIIDTGVRWIGQYYLHGDKLEDEDFFNHSFDPNVLYHCGVCLARRDIVEGEELTVHYGYFMSDDDATAFVDSETGREVNGFGATEAIVKSAMELIQIMGDKP